ncbi:hypothetical protein Gohar_023273 [Gossypium harknessii]|uniref:Uncharacterized protein n=1 Tax=Gossypium harknessii TaxID=34285 RepID=A0A7J9HCW2_9ROSI|nr:hypothetical protein [Gossypium harknessii]
MIIRPSNKINNRQQKQTTTKVLMMISCWICASPIEINPTQSSISSTVSRRTCRVIKILRNCLLKVMKLSLEYFHVTIAKENFIAHRLWEATKMHINVKEH